MLESLDLEPLKFTPFVNNQSGYITKLGGIKMIILLILVVLSIVAFGKELFLKENPIVISSENYIRYPTLNKDSVNIAMAPHLIGGFKIDESEKYLEFNVKIADTDGSRQENSEKTIFTQGKMMPCEDNELFIENKYNITSNLISIPSIYSCLNKSSSAVSNLEGSFGNPKFKIWMITLDYCKNTTMNKNHCKSREEIQRYLPIFNVHIIMSDYYLDSKDNQKPLKETFSTKLLRVSTKNSRRDVFFFRTFNYFSDDGIILEDKSLRKGFYLNKVETDCLYDPDTSEVLRIILSLENIESIYERSYVKFQKVAADIGGFLKFITVILSFISHKYSIVHFYNYISNYFQSQSKLGNGSRSNSQSQIIDNIKNNDMTKTKIYNIVQNTSKFVGIKLNENKQINYSNVDVYENVVFSFFDSIKFYLCCKYFKKSNIKRLIFISDYFKKKYSIENLIYIMNDIEISNKMRFKENMKERSALVSQIIYQSMNSFNNNINKNNNFQIISKLEMLNKRGESKEIV